MKRHLKQLLRLFLGLLVNLHATLVIGQWNTSSLYEYYEQDIKQITLRHLLETGDSAFAFIDIPLEKQEPIYLGMEAILMSDFAQVDSVYNLYCVHDLTNSYELAQEIMVAVDTAMEWTSAWENLETQTNFELIDNLILGYGFEVIDFFNWSFANVALLRTDRWVNSYALIDSLSMASGVEWVENNHSVGDAGKINYQLMEDTMVFDFFFEWNDCFDGCDNYRRWRFKVDKQDLGVSYDGHEDWSFFQMEPLPNPLLCNVLTTLPDSNPMVGFEVFPNPAHSEFTVRLLAPVQQLVLYSSLGKVCGIIEQPNTQQTFDISHLPRGIYFIQAKKNTEQKTCTIILH